MEVEPVRTPATVPDPPAAPAVEKAPVAEAPLPDGPKPEEAPRVAATPVKRPRPVSSAASPMTPVPSSEPDPKSAVTVQLRNSLRQRAQTAVLQTAGRPGGHRSFAALIDEALERELARLAAEFNDGEPFERNAGQFRTGRPFGS
ncbi:hypothetical protein AB6N24_14235 [Cellulomonas sp. 179-A 4D5 NHS]|uniref:hypothetical protein n=1 Tax=Cellulomonas sp. 179-A 4D5 NHS TaxID=3142378 RepID=UPI0039A0FAF0